jgi:hypothetical protein
MVIISRPQWLAADRQIGRLPAGFGNPAGAGCGVLIILAFGPTVYWARDNTGAIQATMSL